MSNQVLVSIVAADALVLEYQAINMPNTENYGLVI